MTGQLIAMPCHANPRSGNLVIMTRIGHYITTSSFLFQLVVTSSPLPYTLLCRYVLCIALYCTVHTVLTDCTRTCHRVPFIRMVAILRVRTKPNLLLTVNIDRLLPYAHSSLAGYWKSLVAVHEQARPAWTYCVREQSQQTDKPNRTNSNQISSYSLLPGNLPLNS